MASINLDTSTRLDITCRKNDTFKLILTCTDEDGNVIDLSSNYAFEIDVRKRSNSSATILSFTEGDSNFTKTAQGKLTISKAASAMNINAGVYVYDLQATNSSESPSNVSTWLAGDFVVIEDVTE
tara:strand:- start:1347 stop:1721 length:375 start_codon:yes stop_codon:yes gene_type:complete